MLLLVALVCLFGLVFHFYSSLLTKPSKLRPALRNQGIFGPQPTFLLGNILDIKKSRKAAATAAFNGDLDSHNCGAALLPFFDQWQKQYGMLNYVIPPPLNF